MTMVKQSVPEQDAAAVRRARFGALPDRIRPEQMSIAISVTVPDPTKDRYSSDEWLVRTSPCLLLW